MEEKEKETEKERETEKEEEMEVEPPAEENTAKEVSDEVYASVRSAVSKMYVNSRSDVIPEDEMEEGGDGNRE